LNKLEKINKVSREIARIREFWKHVIRTRSQKMKNYNENQIIANTKTTKNDTIGHRDKIWITQKYKIMKI